MLLAIAVSFVLVRGSQHIINGPNVSIDTALEKRDAYGSDFLWFRKEGREFLIRDAAVLNRIYGLFEKARATKAEAKRLKHDGADRERREEMNRKYETLRTEAEQAMVPILDEAVRSGTAAEIR